MIHLRPPQSLRDLSGPRVFLAGSIEMGRAAPWQEDLAADLSDCDGLTLLNPRRPDWDSSWEQEIGDPRFREQVEWELTALEAADLVAMYLQPETRAPVSLLELGLFVKEKPLLVCCPPGFWRRGNVQVVLDRYGGELVEDLEVFREGIRHWFLKHRDALG